jgi:hypothetical protein
MKRAYLLADPKHTPLTISAGKILLPAMPPEGHAPVLCVEIEGEVKHQSAGAKLDSKKDTGS